MNAVLVIIALLAATLAAMVLLRYRLFGRPAGRPRTRLLDAVQFTVYRPREISADRWYSLLAFAHLTQRPAGDPKAPDPLEEVERQAERVLHRDASEYRAVSADAVHQIPRAAELTVVPRLDGVEFNPSRSSFRWEQPVHKAEFQLRVLPEAQPGVARGRVTFFMAGIIVGEVPLAVPIVDASAEPTSPVVDHAYAYRKIFASYSHLDGRVVEQFEDFMRSLGDRYVRDVRDLRAGEVWSSGIEELIRNADVFQLFWSWNALASPFVRREWEFALGLDRPEFIRPVYWEDPLPASGDLPPDRLRRLHFYRLSPPAQTEAAPPARLPTPFRLRLKRVPSVAAVLLLTIVCLNAGLLWFWLTLSGSWVTVTRPHGGTLSGGGIQCGSAASDCTIRLKRGATVDLEAIADSGFEFSGFTGNCAGTGRIAVARAGTCGAIFKAVARAPSRRWALTIVKPQGGTIVGASGITCGTLGSSCTVDLPDSAPVELNVLSDVGHTFVKYTGDCSGKGSTTMTADRTCGAVFAADLAHTSPADDGPVTGSAPAPNPAVPPVLNPAGTDEANARAAIERLAKDYCSALERLDPSAVQQIYPQVDRSALQEQFSAYRSLACTVTTPLVYERLDASGGHADVKFGMRQNVLLENGQSLSTETLVTMILSRANQHRSWIIEAIRHDLK